MKGKLKSLCNFQIWGQMHDFRNFETGSQLFKAPVIKEKNTPYFQIAQGCCLKKWLFLTQVPTTMS